MCTFQPGNFTGWSSEGVKPVETCTVLKKETLFKKIKKSNNEKNSYFKMLVAKTVDLQISRATGSSHGPYIGSSLCR